MIPDTNLKLTQLKITKMSKAKIYQRLSVEDIVIPKGISISSVWAITKDGNQIELDCGHICFEDEDSNELNEDGTKF